MSSPTWAAIHLARDLDACDALMRGIAVPRERLNAEVLRRIGEPITGPDVELTKELVLRLEVHRNGPKPRDTETTVAEAAAENIAEPTEPAGSPGLQAITAGELELVTLDAFCAVDEPGAAALVGDEDGAVIPEGGDVMFYGDGGAGKTTLAVDLGCHLAAGDDWLGLPVARSTRVLLVENEGPRPLFRKKLRRKRDHWAGSPIGDRIVVLETPWGHVSFADPECRDKFAAAIRDHEIDVAIVGPVTRSGMNEAGTLQEVRDFMALVAAVRELSGRPVAFVLIHHENKGGQVSGAWEGAGDTLFHVQGQGHGRTRLHVQKARWSSAHHATTLQEGPISTLEGLDVGLTRTFIPGGGKIVPVTASAASKEGGKESFAVFDETHLYVGPELHRLHETIRRNLAKRRSAEPWSLEVSTMFGIGEDSVAEGSHKYAEAAREGRISDPGFLFDHREGPAEFDFHDDDELRAALSYVYGEAAAWMDLERLVAEARDPQTEEALFRRYFLNQPTVRTDSFLPAGAWDKLAQPDKQAADGCEIVLGFDGSVGGAHGLDSTALVGVTVEETPHVFVVACWERPPGVREWLVPRDEVDVQVERAHARWAVREHVCDKSRWYDEYAEWASRYGSPPLIEFPQTRPGMSLASTAFRNAVLRGELSQDGDPRLARHLGNAIATPHGRDGFFINKDSKHSTRTIDLATASVMAHLRAIAPDLSLGRSVYETRGVLVV